jgi:hypothetical protein
VFRALIGRPGTGWFREGVLPVAAVRVNERGVTSARWLLSVLGWMMSVMDELRPGLGSGSWRRPPS